MISLSIIILTWNQRAVTCRCLDALCHDCGDDTEIIVVDNGSTDGSSEHIAAAYPQVRLIRNPENRGVAAGRNCGIQAAKGDKLLLLDNDTIPNREAIDELRRWLDANPSTGIVACRLMDDTGSLQNSFKSYPGLGAKVRNLFGNDNSQSVMLPSAPIRPEYVIGACQMFRRELVDRIGLLDEHIFYGPEDADFCIRARRAGFDTVYLPHVGIVHDWRRATTRSPLSPLARKHIVALIYFYRKHRRWL